MPQPESKPAFKPVDEQLIYLRKGVSEIIPEAELRTKLEHSFKTNTPLRVKLGVDPTAPDLHLGHTVVMRKLKHFQDMGHTAVFLIGDFTAMVGDPTGQSETRPPLSREQVDANSQTYLNQAFRILDRDRTEVRYNSEWLGKLSSYDIIGLAAKYRLARMLEREDFRTRLQQNQPISVHELLYPLFVAYDSVVLKADVELGATEQKFNLLIGREIQREYGQPTQICMTMPILVGLDGERKMSKSLGNYIGITEPPQDMFGKVMSISDDQMWTYYELLTDFTDPVILRLRDEVRIGVLHPRDAKVRLAHYIVRNFHGEDAAVKASQEFDRVYSQRQAPTDTDIVTIPRSAPKKLTALLADTGLQASRSEAERLIKQGGVEVNGERVTDVQKQIDLSQPGELLLRVGKKKFARLKIE
jgi:tyrosyl-tRNA synthetase